MRIKEQETRLTFQEHDDDDDDDDSMETLLHYHKLHLLHYQQTVLSTDDIQSSWHGTITITARRVVSIFFKFNYTLYANSLGIT